MAAITKKVSIDVAELNRFSPIIAKQYDKNSRFLNVTLLNEENEILIDSECTVAINAKRPDEKTKTFAGTVNEDGTVTVPLTYWMLELDGTVTCDISIISATDETILTTTNFELEVQEANGNENEIEDDNSYSILVTLIQQTNDTIAAYEASIKELQGNYDETLKSIQESQSAAEKAASDADNSAQDAAVSAELAAQNAADSGYFFVEAREDGHLWYVQTDNVEDFMLVDNGEGRLVARYGS